MTPEKRVSQRDLAARANLSVAAVSKALRDMPDISEDTRKRVKKLAGEMGYSPNVAARMLATRRSMAIGLLLPLPQIPTTLERIRGAETAAGSRGYATSIVFHDGTLEDEIDKLDLLEGRVDGIVFTPSHPSSKLRTRLRRLTVPFVCMSEPLTGTTCDFVGIDDSEGGRIAAELLVKTGHSRICYFGNAEQTPSDKAVLAGLTAVLSRAGMELRPDDIYWGNTQRDITAANVGKLLREEQRPTALLAISDMAAIWAVRRLRECAVAVPREMSVVGFDDIEFADLAEVPLTSISQPNDEIGRTAAGFLLERIAARAGRRRVPARKKLFPVQLVIRESTRC